MELTRRALPASHRLPPRHESAHPHVAACIFVEIGDIVREQPFARGIDHWPRCRQLLEACHFGKAEEPFFGGHPPLARVIPNDVPKPAPITITDLRRQVESDGSKARAIEAP